MNKQNSSPSHDYDKEMKYQEEFLKKQETEMGVSKNTLDKFPTFKGIPTIVLSLGFLIGGSVTAYHVIDSVLDTKKDSHTKVLPLTTTPESLQDVLKIDSIKLEHYKQTLDSVEREEFEQFSPQRQWDHIQHNN